MGFLIVYVVFITLSLLDSLSKHLKSYLCICTYQTAYICTYVPFHMSLDKGPLGPTEIQGSNDSYASMNSRKHTKRCQILNGT